MFILEENKVSTDFFFYIFFEGIFSVQSYNLALYQLPLMISVSSVLSQKQLWNSPIYTI